MYFQNLKQMTMSFLHYVMCIGERDSMRTSLEQSKALLVASRQKEAELGATTLALQAQIQTLVADKEEVNIARIYHFRQHLLS